MDTNDQFKNSMGHSLTYISHQIELEIHNTITNDDKDGYKDLKEYTFSNLQIISFLHRNEEHDIFQKDLEKELAIKASTVSCILRRMEKKDMIRRIKIDSDARVKRLVLTTKTRRLEQKLLGIFNSIENRFTDLLTEDEYCNMVYLVEKVKKSYKSKL